MTRFSWLALSHPRGDALDRRRVLVALVTVCLIVLVCTPAMVVFGLGWVQLPHFVGPGAPVPKETTSPEGWTLFALVYLAWLAGLTVLLVWTFDRIGHRWSFPERTPRPDKKQRRRDRATMQALNAEEQASLETMRRREEREARRRRDREATGPDGGGA